uniref:UDP-glucuronosyltransferase n=1 Tax=Mastacembelus armatus TaxID=205130 RepID=A0A3Q3SM93_9TELE
MSSHWTVMVHVFLPLPALLLFLVLPFSPVDGGRVLVFPGEYSHWLNMRNIMEELVRRNHSVTVLIPDASPSVNYICFLLQVPFSRSELHGTTQEVIRFFMYDFHVSSPLQRFFKVRDWMWRMTDLMVQQCDSMLKNEQLMATLRDAAFDVVLLDPMVMCGDLVADLLGLPLILSLRFSFGGVFERHCGHAPAPPSYVPVTPLPYSDRMTVVERLMNTVTYVGTSAMTELKWYIQNKSLMVLFPVWAGTPSSVCGTLGNADIWLIRTFWDLDTPRPTPPNFKYVGGLHCKPAKKLPEDMEVYVQSSGDAGVVVVSFGSMVTNLTSERADVIAMALGRIPQKVIWRYSGETPKGLAANIKIYDWIPQNDLLGHPKTRAFVTHGGTNGLYEAVYHGVPVVGVPLFGDQHYNLAHLTRRTASIVIDFNRLTADEMTEALHTVINQPSYRSNMKHLSALHRDQPMTPLNTAVFWVEFVMRHSGAQHLRLASHHLNWFQYHSVDTAAFLLLVTATTTALCWAGVRCFLQRCRRRGGREKND